MDHFQSLLAEDRQQHQPRNGVAKRMQLNRSRIVEEVIKWFDGASENDLMRQLHVKFDDEDALDLGGVTANMYTEVSGFHSFDVL